MFTHSVKPIRIIGDPDNQLPNEWSSTVVGAAATAAVVMVKANALLMASTDSLRCLPAHYSSIHVYRAHTLHQARSTFHVARAKKPTLEKFGLHAGNTKFIIQNKSINIHITTYV